MPILPIDLQTLFGQSLQVGKEQAVQKEASPLAQSAQGAQLVQKTEARDTSVNETAPEEEGPEQVKDRARRGAERRRRQAGKKQPPARPSAPARGVLSDPALGRNVDITS
jgi:hypothetical protein